MSIPDKNIIRNENYRPIYLMNRVHNPKSSLQAQLQVISSHCETFPQDSIHTHGFNDYTYTDDSRFSLQSRPYSFTPPPPYLHSLSPAQLKWHPIRSLYVQSCPGAIHSPYITIRVIFSKCKSYQSLYYWKSSSGFLPFFGLKQNFCL